MSRKGTAGRGRKTVLLLCTAAVIAGGYFGLRRMETRQTLTESAGSFDLTEKTADDLKGITWTEEGETRSYTLREGTWEAENAPAQAVDQDEMQSLAENLVNLQATRKIENVSDTGDYGLADPAVTVTAQWRSGNTVYRMGDATPFGDGYYLTVSGQENTVYTIADPLKINFGNAR